MKRIEQQDVDALRKHIWKQHDILLENCVLMQQVANSDRKDMLQRLEAAEQEMDGLLALPEPVNGQDPRVQALHEQLQELRVYFGAPTGRPLEARGVDFIAPYLKCLRLLFQISGDMRLYVESVRTELALLEYCLEQQQEYDYFRLADTLSICNYREQFTHVTDAQTADLGHYLLLIQALLMPLLFSREQEELRWGLSGVFLELGATFLVFDCGPEEPAEGFCDSFLLSMMIQLMQDTPSQYAARRCLDLSYWLWEYPLDPKQRQLAAQCHKNAKEVLKDA